MECSNHWEHSENCQDAEDTAMQPDPDPLGFVNHLANGYLANGVSPANLVDVDLLFEYCKLASQVTLTDAEADRMEAMYTAAELNPLLDFLIHELDALLIQQNSQSTSCQFEPNSEQAYQNQLAWLREYLEGMPYDEDYRKQVQRLLQSHGFYNGPIDGVLGSRSLTAVKRFQQAQQLKVDGVPGRETFTALQAG